MGDDPDVSIVEFAVWLADRAGVSFEECGHSEQEERLWDADAIFCEVLRRVDVARLTGERDEARRKLDQEWESANGWAAKASELDQRLAAAEAESERLREALGVVMAETGTSSLAHHAARDALRGATP